MHKIVGSAIKYARKYLFHTWLGKTRFASWAYALLFQITAPDLIKPVAFRGMSLYLDPGDRSYVPAVVQGWYEQKELDIFEFLVADAAVLFDVGANIGIYSILGCARSETLISHAFEPVAENQELLRRNIERHGLSRRIRVHPIAASDRTGTAHIHLGMSGNHSLVNHQGRDSRVVDTVTLDDFSEKMRVVPDIVKIDVEGHEEAVVTGCLQTLSRARPALFLEYTPVAHVDVGTLVSQLTSLFGSGFVIDEIAGTVKEIELSDLNRRRSYNLLIASRDDHLRTIRGFLAHT